MRLFRALLVLEVRGLHDDVSKNCEQFVMLNAFQIHNEIIFNSKYLNLIKNNSLFHETWFLTHTRTF